jgi:ubiquinone/menaquinone biosynthesis C-methylase UbiE
MTQQYLESPDPVGEDRAYLDFVLGLKQYWSRQLYPELGREYSERVGNSVPRTAEEAGPIIEGLPSHAFFGWMERGVQKMMWRRIEKVVVAQAELISDVLNRPVEQPLGRLELNPHLELPGYYTDIEYHIQPGGVWSQDTNALVYEVGAKVVMLGSNDDYLFHRLFTETAVPRAEYRAILDLGCGFGKSTRPFVDAFPPADVVGIDLSAANLKLAHQQAERLGKRIKFSQRNAEATGYPEQSFDLVTATMLIHELPMPVLRRVIRETYRLLRPTGRVVFLDFHRTGDPFRDFAMIEHGARNNEPFMPHLFRTDVLALLRDEGFVDPEMLPFDERGRGLIEDGCWPERSEWHFPWVVIRAQRAT